MRSRPAPDSRPDVARLLAAARFELVPTATAEQQLAFLPRGATVSVTSSPRRGLEPTLSLAARLTEEGYLAVPHVSARLVQSRAHLAEVSERLSAARVREIFVVGGDSTHPAGPFDSALSLLEALAESGHAFDRVGIAGYPERHPLVDEGSLLQALAAKQRFASYVVTQICYAPEVIFGWIGRVRRRGIGLPVYVGLPGVVHRGKLLEMSLRVGVGDSIRYLRKHGSLVARLVRRGGYRPDTFLATVSSLRDAEDATAGVAGFHINTFNQVESTERWRRAFIARAGSSGLPAS